MRKKVLIFLLLVFAVAAFFVFFGERLEKVEAGSNDNVFGWAWSENIGWISFNNTSGGGGVDYGVNIDTSTGLLSGYAWSSTGPDTGIGWISFCSEVNTTNCPNSISDLAGCPFAPCQANYNSANDEVSGWARAYRAIDPQGQTLGGWDGWIRLRGNFHGVWIEDVAAPDPDEFRNWAWGSDDASGVALEGDEVIGWISFNRLNCDANRDGFSDGTPPGCPSIGTSVSDYKVMTTFAPTINTAPTVTNLTESAPNYCVTGSQRFLSFTIQDDPGDQVSYTTEDGFGNKIDACSGSVNIPSDGQYTVNCAPTLNWGLTYNWTVIAMDQDGLSSVLVSCSDYGACFTMPPHAYPDVNFEWDPLDPSIGQRVQFCSVVGSISDDEDGDILTPPYTYNCLPVNPTVCYDVGGSSDDGSKCLSFSWVIPDFAYGPLSGSNFRNPYGSFNVSGAKDITLTVTDKSNQFCSLTKPLLGELPLPEWKEITPF